MRTQVKMAAVATAMAAAFIVAPISTPAANANVTCQSGFGGENGEGTGDLNISVNLKENPYTGCNNVAYVTAGKRVYFHCYAINDYGNKWWYVRVAGTSTSGWTSADNITPVWNDENGNGKIDYVRCSQIF